MKIKTLVAASALAAAGFVGVATQSASAACGVTLEAHNDDSNSATVNWADSDVRIRTWISLPFGLSYWQEGPWAQISTGSTTVPGNDTRSINETFTFNCPVQRQYRFEVSENGSTRWVYFPSVNSGGSTATGWTTNNAPHFHL
jgi:hypothetical protein